MDKQPTIKIPNASIILDEEIYPRKGIDHRRVGMFSENIRDGFLFDPVEVEAVPDTPGLYRLLDGAHRWSAYKETGASEVEAIVITELNGIDPLLYAAQKAIGPRQLTEDEARNTARRACTRNPGLSSADIGKAIGRARRTVDVYIADIRAVNQMDMDLKVFRMNLLGLPQDRMAMRLGMNQKTVHNHLVKMAVLPKLLNSDLSQGFTVAQVAEKHGWTEPMVWSLALEGKDDLQSKPAMDESGTTAIFIDDYLSLLKKSGWQQTHIIQAPMSAQRFSAVVVSAMQKKKILGVTSRYVIILKQL